MKSFTLKFRGLNDKLICPKQKNVDVHYFKIGIGDKNFVSDRISVQRKIYVKKIHCNRKSQLTQH